MKVAVIQFPGANCDQDALFQLRTLGLETDYVWHSSGSLDGFEAVILPGGFTFGDYLRCGAIAKGSAIMTEVRRFANEGRPVLGICNGFQILCEAQLLDGALLQNAGQKFVCRDVYLRSVNSSSLWTRGVSKVLRVPIAHGEGRFECDDSTLERLYDQNQIAFQYVNPGGDLDEAFNPNGSKHAIAGILNSKGNVLGLMPHPERAVDLKFGSADGIEILGGLRLIGVG